MVKIVTLGPGAEGRFVGWHDPYLLKAVPAGAIRILLVECGQGSLASALKALVPDRQIFGLARDAEAASRVRGDLESVWVGDAQEDCLELAPDSLDCIIYGEALAHLDDPLAVLERHSVHLAPDGIVLCWVRNAQHYSVISQILRGDLHHDDLGATRSGRQRMDTYASFSKLLLDAGFAPTIEDVCEEPVSREFLMAASLLCNHVGANVSAMVPHFGSRRYLFKGSRLPAAGVRSGAAEPLTFVACVNNEAVLKENLLSSPCLLGNHPHEVLLMRGCSSAAEGLNRGIDAARNTSVVCVHQDVYLPKDWPLRFVRQRIAAEAQYGSVAVLGMFGSSFVDGARTKCGHVVDRDRVLRENGPLPQPVDTLDELLLAVHQRAPLRFDPRLGFHLYGADICLSARSRGLQAVSVDALCFHNSQTTEVPPAFLESARILVDKWPLQLPIATSCALIDDAWLSANRGRMPPRVRLNKALEWVETAARRIRMRGM